MKSANKKKQTKEDSPSSQFNLLKPLPTFSMKSLRTESLENHSYVREKRRYDTTLFHKTSFLLKPLSQNPELFIHSPSLNKKALYTLRQGKPMNRKAIIPHSVSVKLGLEFLNEKQKLLSEDTFTLVTAKKWLIYDVQQNTIIKGYKHRLLHDSTNLGCLMIFWTIYQIIKREYIGISSFQILVRSRDYRVGKNVYPLEEDSMMSVEDALYTLLLSSSGAVALALANNIGYFLMSKKRGQYFNCFDLTDYNRQENVNYFLKIMSRNVQFLNLRDTSFRYTQGLICCISSAFDIARLQSLCFKIPLFSRILSVKNHTARIKYINSQGLVQRLHLIENNNKLLIQNCIGGIIGSSRISGECFTGLFEGNFIVVVLGSSGKEQKFADCMRLVKWVHNKLRFCQQL